MCEFCERFDFGSASYEIDRYGTRIVMAGGSYRFPPERQFGLSVGQKRTLVQIHKSRVIVKA